MSKALTERAEREQRVADENKAVHSAELKRIADAHDARMRREAAERAKKEAAEQAKRDVQFNAELDADAKSLFYAGNPGAPDSLWQNVREEYKALVLRRRAEAAADASAHHSLYLWR